MAASQTFSNSPLVVYTKLSPNHSGKRTRNIDSIAIHCMAGNCTIETCGQIFAPSSRQASSNYGIGSDGRIGMYVEEKNRSWCTSSNAVDQRAVTIEVANDGGAPQWHVSDKAMVSLIKLCADICKRNNIKTLKWRGDKGLIGQVNLQNMVVHRWTAAKSCPGDYLFNKHPYIVEEVNKLIGGSSTVVTPPDQPTNVIKGSAEKTIWNFLKGKGLNDYAVAGIMGNLYAESGLLANNLQNSYEKKLGYTDDTYTAAVDSGKYTNFVRDSAGYGLAQWTYWSRKEGLLNYAKKTKKSIGDITMQLEFLWTEMQSSAYKKMMTTLKSATSVRQASDVFLLDFERPASQTESVKKTRAGYGESYYKKNADADNTNFPYRVKVNDATVLNIRKGPGTNYAVSGQIRDNGIYTILEESAGTGAKKWGRLKSGAGWISLDYCIKLS